MELQKGYKLLIQQYKALFTKNLLLAWRNKRATFLQLFSSIFFILLLFIIQKAIEGRFSFTTAFESLRDPQSLIDPPIPPCEDKYYTKLPCYDFVWSGSDSARIRSIVDRIRDNNPGRPIPSDKVKSFHTKNDVDAWLFANPMTCPGALHFVDRTATVISYGLQTNSTPAAKRGDYEDPTFKFQIPLQIAAEREIARSLIGDPSFSWVVNLKEFAHPVVQTFSSVGAIGPSLFLAIAMFGFVFQISSLIVEKELKLRQSMAMMGLYDTAYWLSWLTWEGIIALLSSLFTVLFGMIFQFDFFLHNSFAVVFLVFFFFQLNMVSFAFMFSSFISKSTSSTSVGFSVYIVGFLTQVITFFGFPYSDNYSGTYRTIWSFYPPNLLAKAIQLLSVSTATPEDPGITWANRGKCAPNDPDCLITVNDIYIWLLATFILWGALAIYFDNIFPNSSGVRKSAFYFLNPGYWSGKGGNRVEVPPIEHTSPDDEDVLEEENIVKQQHREGVVDQNFAVQIHGLVKVYPGKTNIGCCICKKSAPYHALKGLWLNFPKDQLFCLLGPNGAGKTTAINCLTGITPVTEGDALIYGHSIRSSIGMSNIQKMLGVCPQFDILWDALSGQEHLYLFASIKGLPPASLNMVVRKLLAEVRLTESARVRARSYSGGMKRRLSVAIALIGEPKLVILDEPTTGMDPITRRHVWDIIENAKKGRAVILTTHSMEEADILSDRIGIMTKGRLRCIGNSIRLKSRFGTGYVANISFSGTNGDVTHAINHEEVKLFFKDCLDVLPKEENKSFVSFVIPHDREGQLTNFFEELENRKGEFGISDIQLSLTTLEEVFLNIAKQAEFESAAAEGRFTTLTLTSGTSLQIPVGARYIGIPGTISTENPRGTMVEVFWEQDDAGTLCIFGHSNETPIPPHVQFGNVLSNNPTRNFLGGSEQPRVMVIDPNEVANPTS
uniref:ABC transporter A family member 2-like isoform X2 n=1 Tax=Erigeron canadensis TaxID=72917 RepID=UPI001CB8E9CF|nr:ABC transporter A family member 2-like isoform X2 [Erigeron canadensis]